MALSDLEIWEEIQSGLLVIEPLDAATIGPSSVDLRLATTALVFRNVPRGLRVRLRDARASDLVSYATEKVDLTNQPLELAPGQLAIGFTRERIQVPAHLCGRVEGRSSYARLGIAVHNTAPLIQPGFNGQIALELTNHGPLTVELDEGLPICQLVLERLGRPSSQGYRGQFQDQQAG